MDFGEGNDLAEIDLTYSPLRGISRARRVLGRPIVCIIQVIVFPKKHSGGFHVVPFAVNISLDSLGNGAEEPFIWATPPARIVDHNS